ncbi:hypothetical protein Tco_0295233 [Tanacetum coccineum]
MVVLDSCPKHNMVAYLEKSEGNEEFHEIIDFLKRSFIHSMHITAKVAGKSVSISEASIRSDLLFDDADVRNPLEAQLTHPKTFITYYQTIPDSIPETVLVDLGSHSPAYLVSDQAKEIQDLKAQITKLKKQAKPVIKHHKAWLKSVSLKQRFPRKSFSKKHRVHKESVSKQGRKFAKGESSVQRDPLFDELPEDTVDHMETENAQN